MTQTVTYLEALQSRLGERVSTGRADLAQHAKDEGYPQTYLPDAVVYAESEQDVLAVLEIARAHGVPVTPFAAGSSLEGNALPVKGGISLDLSRMSRILSIDAPNFCATVEPGVLYRELSRQARPHGLFFAVDPGADCSLGGMASTCASGTAAVRYGTMRQQVLSMRVALLDGRVLTLGSKARKSSAGYDLKDLFIGAEGTLGIITELTVRLHPLPTFVASARSVFETVDAAVEAAVMVIGSGLHPERIELVDAETVRAVNLYVGSAHPELPTLWIEVAGSSRVELEGQLALIGELCQDAGGSQFATASAESERAELWAARHNAYYALKRLFPDHTSQTTDVCVPISALPEAIAETERLARELDLHAPVMGHVGDGNFHVLLHAHPDDADAWARIGRMSEGMVAKAHALGGTCTGEHGVGLRKRKYLEAEYGSETVAVMREVKALFDPQGLLNPGKILP
ncbi:D-lactate dehydrogenase (cytochrome) [Deinobacterium chartae]|uniref:D-lactate dehydrogenase (cytochrome) n=1 Tax=Deinobacterium chartae TaxID=521158 RepID=A0A841HYW1_9DEIO|nr:FAD-linked oxidase C-terminal domain-containing protein [Deinobacterium chartae]MBB6097409.1 D-lactate dehydrogenase (cytochrome) [Deinobacterium chartae]